MEFTDQMNRCVRLDSNPQRIVSLVPSQTQLLHALGLEDRVVGITKFCIHPDDWFRSKPRVGGTKAISFDKVRELNPDLILGNKEENERSDIESLEKDFPVWMSDIYNLEDALEMIHAIGELTETQSKAKDLVELIQSKFSPLHPPPHSHSGSGSQTKTVAYFIWNEPGFCAGTNTFIDDMLQRCGLKNYFSEERYPEFKVGEGSPDYIFLSSEPFPFKESHRQDFQKQFPDSKVVLVDGEMFSWYGSKLLDAPAYFEGLLKQLTSQ